MKAKWTLDKSWKKRCEQLRVEITPYPDLHQLHCRTYKAANGPVGIACEHNFDCCPKCDPCTCNAKQT